MSDAPVALPALKFYSRRMVMSADLNGAQSLFGGQLMAWVDQEAAVFARCQLNYPDLGMVTKLISTIDFVAPAKLGDIIEFGLRTIHVGRTSIAIECEVRNKQTKQRIVHIEKIVFVTVNDGVPAPHERTWENLNNQP